VALRTLDPGQFFKAKRLEQDQRYTRHDDTPYSLEPNCKESPGGLRDLQLIGWISRAAGFGTHWRDLARHLLITPAEAAELRELERFLQHVRIRLHHLTGRREDRLLFDHQETLARCSAARPPKPAGPRKSSCRSTTAQPRRSPSSTPS
jgi:[protein-PII] uridylyltransferase